MNANVIRGVTVCCVPVYIYLFMCDTRVNTYTVVSG